MALSSRELWGRDRKRASERERGVPVSLGLRFSSARVAEATIISVLRLPVLLRDESNAIQDADGNFLYDPDYSDESGPDVVAGGEI